MNISTRIKKILEQTRNINKKVKIVKYKNESKLEEIFSKHDNENTIILAVYVGDYLGKKRNVL